MRCSVAFLLSGGCSVNCDEKMEKSIRSVSAVLVGEALFMS
jgi:hypothetical protein